MSDPLVLSVREPLLWLERDKSFYRLIPQIISAGNSTIKGPRTREWVDMSTWLDTLPEISQDLTKETSKSSSNKVMYFVYRDFL